MIDFGNEKIPLIRSKEVSNSCVRDARGLMGGYDIIIHDEEFGGQLGREMWRVGAGEDQKEERDKRN